jgi:hypothetical protein
VIYKGNDITGETRKMHTENLHNLCLSPNTIRVITSRGTRSERNVAHMEEKFIHGLAQETLKEGVHLEGLGTNGRKILKCIFKK